MGLFPTTNPPPISQFLACTVWKVCAAGTDVHHLHSGPGVGSLDGFVYESAANPEESFGRSRVIARP